MRVSARDNTFCKRHAIIYRLTAGVLLTIVVIEESIHTPCAPHDRDFGASCNHDRHSRVSSVMFDSLSGKT